MTKQHRAEKLTEDVKIAKNDLNPNKNYVKYVQTDTNNFEIKKGVKRDVTLMLSYQTSYKTVCLKREE